MSTVEKEPRFKAGDIVTVGASKTRWRVVEVVEGGVTILTLQRIGREL